MLKSRKTFALTLVTAVTILLTFFNNCSKVAVSDLASDVPQQEQGQPLIEQTLPSSFSKVSVGTSDLADLKMLMIVDNSYTMKQNNINLAKSFPTLFNAENSDNLSRFAVTSGLITVAQKTPAATILDQARLNQLLSWQVDPATINVSQLPILRQGGSLGKLAGDAIGFSVRNQSGSYIFEPALILGSNDKGELSPEISKGKSESPTQMVNEFVNRLSMLQDLPLTNYNDNSDILDKESGLCALARVLRSPTSFFKPGDIPVITVFSDEDDADISGKSCLAGYSFSLGKDDLIDGVCETRKTVFNYQVGVPKPAKCQYGYQDAFNWSLVYSSTAPRSSVSFYKVTSYSCPQTQVNFKVVSQWQRKKTSMVVTYKTFNIYDGVKVYGASAQTRTVSVNDYKTVSECESLSKASINTSSEEWVSNTCSQSLVADNTCTFGDSTCVIGTQEARSALVAGDVISNCASQAKAANSNYISGTESCALTGTTVSLSSTAPGCSPVISTTQTTVTGISKDLSVQSTCDSEAKARGGYVTAQYPATCSTTSATSPVTRTGTFLFSSYPSVTATGECPPDVKTQAIATAGTNSSSVSSCMVTSFRTSSLTENLTATSCADQSAAFCSTHPSYKSCQLTSTVAASTTPTAQSSYADEDLTCASKCQDSATGFCKPTSMLASVDPNMTIEQYLTQAIGASVCTSTTAASGTQISSYNARLLSEKDKLCIAKTSAGIPVYNRTTKAPYRINGLAPDYVAGNQVDSSNVIQPKTDLLTYILQRSQEIFGKQTPIIHVFVRTPSDPVGDGGSKGLAYMQLATATNGRIDSVLSPDYSGALQDLSTIIKSQILRSFKVPAMGSTNKVVGVKLTSKSSRVTRALASTEWAQSGQTVQIEASVPLNLEDELEFEFK